MFLLLAFLASTTASITNCNTGSVFTITKLAADPPDTVVAGQNVTWTLLYTSPATVTGGTASSALTFNGIPFSPEVTDLCDSIVCPLAAGTHDGSSWFIFPSGVSGKIITKVTWADASGNQLLCISYSVKSTVLRTRSMVRWITLRTKKHLRRNSSSV
jgi:hypothetical protein